MEYLLLIHVGPVQEFIATARRSRDLWYGSWVLSELAKAAAQSLEKPGNKLVFPAPGMNLAAGSTLNVANRIVAIVTQPTEAAAAAKSAVEKRLDILCQDAFAYLHSKKAELQSEKDAIKQIKDLPEFYWAAVKLSDDYSKDRRRVEALLAARKNTRHFRQSDWQSNSPKSSLDGVRESVIPEDQYPNRSDSMREQKIQALYEKFRVRGAERMSGVDLLKRLGNRGDEARFPSTSHMAARPLLHKLSNNPEIPKLWQTYLNALPAVVRREEKVSPRFNEVPFGDTDGSVLFVSRLAELLEGKDLERAQKALQQFLKQSADGEEPIPYYALLLGDGDGMGEIIDAQDSIEAHQELSQTLATFAEKAGEVVSSFNGALVYAGGDDVLAFLPLHKVLACAKLLTDTFQTHLGSYKTVKGNPATFSAGIAVCHHLEPLSDALTLVRATEKEAKAVPGKNGLALAVDKRGGITRIVAGKWPIFYPRLEWYVYYQRREVDAFPGGAPYELRNAVLEMGGETAVQKNPQWQSVVQQEGKRVLMRKRSARGQQKLDEEVKSEIEAVVMDKNQSLGELADTLVIARVLAQAQDQAGLPVQQPVKLEEAA